MNDTATIGDNRAPADANPIKDRLTEDYGTLERRKTELLDAMERMPTSIEDEATAGKVSDFIMQLSAAAKNADKCRVDEKEIYLSGGRTVDGYFKAISGPLLDAKKKVEGVLTIFQRAKAAEERRAREEQERIAREEQARADKKAQAKIDALNEEGDLAAAIEAEEVAKQAAADAEEAKRDADAKAAELSRTRSDSGTVSSLRTYWDFSNLDRASIDLESIRQHLSEDALEKAVRSFIKAGGRELKGVKIFENTKTVVR